MSREDLFIVKVSVNGTDLGYFDSFDGGDKDSEEVKYKEGGGLGEEVALGGSTSRDNFTIARLYKLTRDHPIFLWLDGLTGKGSVVAVKQPLDVNRNAFGSPTTYKGTVKKVSGPKADSRSNDPAMLTLEVSADGPIS